MKGPDTFKQIKETIFTEESKYNMLSDYRMVIHGIEWIINTGYDYISIMWDDTRLPREYHYKEIDYEMPKMIGEYDPNKDFKDFTGMPMLSHAKGIDKVYENPRYKYCCNIEFYLKEWKEYVATDFIYSNHRGSVFSDECYYEEGGYSYKNPVRFKEENNFELIPMISDAEMTLYQEFKVLYCKVVEQFEKNNQFLMKIGT